MTLSIEDDFSPISVGDTGAKFTPTFVDLTGNVVDLTGATLSMSMREMSTDIVQACTGEWMIDPYPTTGKASYAYSAADVALAGVWELSIMITIGGKPEHTNKKILQIDPV